MRHSSSVSSIETVHVRVTGKVQGVGYRLSTVRRAHMIGVRGWVRNRRDGSVEAVAQGAASAVEALVAWARNGPPGARVTQLSCATAEDEPLHPGFELRPTV